MKEFLTITSRENPLIKQISSLQSSAKARSEMGLFVLEGLRICQDAFENSIKFSKLVVGRSASERFKTEIISFSENSEECYIIPDDLFKKISDTTSPQGIIALGKIAENKAETIDKSGRYIALENISDPSNLGAISRTAEALGVSGIILSGDSCDPYSPKALRSSMGTLLRMPVFIFENFSAQIANSGLKSYACVVDGGAKLINEISFEDGSVLIIGNEANGITETTKSVANEKITIPMAGRVESLNAAVAASISMWEMMKK